MTTVPSDLAEVTGDSCNGVTGGHQQRPSAVTPRVVRDAALDWVKFDARIARDGSIDPVDKALYAALASFADSSTRDTDPDPNGEDVPTRVTLAACIGRSVDTVDRATERLEKLGVIRVERRKDPKKPKSHLPSVYHLLDHEWWDDRAAVRAAARRAVSRPGGGRMDAATPGRMDAATPSRMDAAVPLPVEKEVKNPPPTPRMEPAAGAVPRPREGGDSFDNNPNAEMDALVAEVIAVRNAWSATAVRAALTHPSVVKRNPEVVRRAILILAADRANTMSPGRLLIDGPWWREAEKAAGRPAAPTREPLCSEPLCDSATRRLFTEAGKYVGPCPTCNPTASVSERTAQ